MGGVWIRGRSSLARVRTGCPRGSAYISGDSSLRLWARLRRLNEPAIGGAMRAEAGDLTTQIRLPVLFGVAVRTTCARRRGQERPTDRFNEVGQRCGDTQRRDLISALAPWCASLRCGAGCIQGNAFCVWWSPCDVDGQGHQISIWSPLGSGLRRTLFASPWFPLLPVPAPRAWCLPRPLHPLAEATTPAVWKGS